MGARAVLKNCPRTYPVHPSIIIIIVGIFVRDYERLTLTMVVQKHPIFCVQFPPYQTESEQSSREMDNLTPGLHQSLSIDYSLYIFKLLASWLGWLSIFFVLATRRESETTVEAPHVFHQRKERTPLHDIQESALDVWSDPKVASVFWWVDRYCRFLHSQNIGDHKLFLVCDIAPRDTIAKNVPETVSTKRIFLFRYPAVYRLVHYLLLSLFHMLWGVTHSPLQMKQKHKRS